MARGKALKSALSKQQQTIGRFIIGYAFTVQLAEYPKLAIHTLHIL